MGAGREEDQRRVRAYPHRAEVQKVERGYQTAQGRSINGEDQVVDIRDYARAVIGLLAALSAVVVVYLLATTL